MLLKKENYRCFKNFFRDAQLNPLPPIYILDLEKKEFSCAKDSGGYSLWKTPQYGDLPIIIELYKGGTRLWLSLE